MSGRGVFVNEGADHAATEQDQPTREPTREEALLAEIRALRERLDRLERTEQQQDLSHDPGPSPDSGRGLGL